MTAKHGETPNLRRVLEVFVVGLEEPEVRPEERVGILTRIAVGAEQDAILILDDEVAPEARRAPEVLDRRRRLDHRVGIFLEQRGDPGRIVIEHRHVRVDEDRARVLGVHVLARLFDQLVRRRGMVSSVYTLPEYRRRGISRNLMLLLIARAKDLQIYRLVLWASEMGRPLYEGLDFEQSSAMELDTVEFSL